MLAALVTLLADDNDAAAAAAVAAAAVLLDKELPSLTSTPSPSAPPPLCLASRG